MKRATRYVPHFQSVREEGVKFFERALCVKEGDIFNVERKNILGNNNNSSYHEDRNSFIEDYIIDYNIMIDDMVFYYTDFIALQIKGLISLRNIYHLAFITQSLFEKDIEYVYCAVETIIKKFKSVPFDEMERLFQKYTKKNMEHYYGRHVNLDNFLNQKPDKYTISGNENDYRISLTNIEELSKKLWELPILPDKKYFQRDNGTSNLGSTNDGTYPGITPSEKKSIISK